MKAVIVDKKGRYAVALSDDGSIIKIRNRNYEIGQVFEMKKRLNFDIGKFTKITAAAALFLLVIGIGAFTYFHQSTYVSLDVNPSVEFSLNMYDRVLSVKGVNDDGEQILENIDIDNLSNKTIDEAIKLTVQNIADQGFFDSDVTGEMVIAVSGKDLNKSAELADKLKQISEKAAKEKNVTIEVEAEGVGRERVEQAKALGITPGKLRLIEKLENSAEDPESIIVEEWKDKTVKEIQKAIRARKIEKSLSEDQKAIIEPALEAYKAAVAKAGEDFNTAFDAIKENYKQQINAFRTQYSDSNELRTKLNELKRKMLEERRSEMEKLSDAVKAAREAFLKATENLGLPEDVLLQYLRAVTENIMTTDKGYKDFLRLFDVVDKARTDTNSKDESKSAANDNESKPAGDNDRKSATDNRNGKGSGKDKTNSNEKNIKDTSSLTQSDSADTNSKAVDKDKTGKRKTEQKKQSDKKSEQSGEQQPDKAKERKENGKVN